jgi:hypothetical protein
VRDARAASDAPRPVGADGRGAVRVLGVDPGLRVGLAWVAADGRLLRSAIVDADALRRLEVPFEAVVAVGDGTGSRESRSALARPGRTIVVVDETATSEEGRRLYWRDHPARGLARWLPAGMRVPPRPTDDYAAYAIALRWLGAAAARGSEERPARP